jgi:hypothetical protein
VVAFSYPFCGSGSPADFPVPVVNGEAVAPVLNTLPAETVFYQEVGFSHFFFLPGLPEFPKTLNSRSNYYKITKWP